MITATVKKATLYASATFVACVVSLFPKTGEASENYPNRPISLVVPYSPGGPSDVIARIITQSMGEHLGQSVVVENKPGATGSIAFESVARAKPDGYTLVLVDIALAANGSLSKSVKYDPVRDFTPIGKIGFAPVVLVVPTSKPWNTLEEFVTAAKNKETLSYASAGAGSPPHLYTEMFASRAGVSLLHVPYKGASPALNDVAAGNVDAMFVGVGAALPLINSNKLRPLVVSSDRRSVLLPSTPTFAEVDSSFADLQFGPWWGISGPADMNKDTIKKINAALNAAVATSSVQEIFRNMNISAEVGSPEKLGEFIGSEVARWGSIIESSKISVD